MAKTRNRKLTYRIQLAGEQDRMCELILYVAKKCESHKYFGKTKLNKILWRADFEAFAQRHGVPVTGRPYQRLEYGPAPLEMAPLLPEMVNEGLLSLEEHPIGNRVEVRPVALEEPVLDLFSADDLRFVDQAIAHYENMTGKESSDDSHGIAWRTHENGDGMPYEAAYLSDDFTLTKNQKERLSQLIEEANVRSE